MRNLCLFIILITVSCNIDRKYRNDLTKIVVGNNLFQYKDLYLSEIVKDIQYIPLEFTKECPIGRIIKVGYRNKNIFVLDPDGLYMFDQYGKYIKRIGNKGKGPGEFLLARTFTMSSKSIFLLPNCKNTIIEYDLNGNFVKEITSDFDITGSVQSIEYLNDTILTMDCMPFQRLSPIYFKTAFFNTRTGDVQKINSTLPVPDKVDQRNGLYGRLNHYWKYNGSSFYLEDFNDTILCFHHEKLEPLYYIDLGSYKIDREKYFDKRILEQPDIFWIKNIKETKQFIYFQYYFDCKSQIAQYDKISHNFQVNRLETKGYNFLHDAEHTLKPCGLLNDYDGGPSFWPNQQISDTIWIHWYDVFELKEFFRERKNRTECISIQKRDELLSTIHKLKDEDNPFLIIMKLK